MESYILILIAASISLVSALAIIITYIFNNKVQRLEGIKLVIILELLDCCLSLIVYIPTPIYTSNSILCNIQGILIQFCTLSEVLWTGFISAQLYWGLLNQNNSYFSLVKGFTCICIFSFATSLIPFIFNSYRNVGAYCYIYQSHDENRVRDALLRFFLFTLFRS